VILTFDIKPGHPEGASEYSLEVLSKLFKTFMIYRGNNVCPNVRRASSLKTVPWPTLTDDTGINAEEELRFWPTMTAKSASHILCAATGSRRQQSWAFSVFFLT